MDDARFDGLTRRFVLGRLAGGSLAALGWGEGVAKRKKRRRRRKGKQGNQQCTGAQTRCGNRCCPVGQRCENETCVAECDLPFFCNLNPETCGGNDECLCTRTVDNVSACADTESGSLCSEFQACAASDECPAGRMCVLCSCDGQTLEHRCLKPCPPAQS